MLCDDCFLLDFSFKQTNNILENWFPAESDSTDVEIIQLGSSVSSSIQIQINILVKCLTVKCLWIWSLLSLFLLPVLQQFVQNCVTLDVFAYCFKFNLVLLCWGSNRFLFCSFLMRCQWKFYLDVGETYGYFCLPRGSRYYMCAFFCASVMSPKPNLVTDMLSS